MVKRISSKISLHCKKALLESWHGIQCCGSASQRYYSVIRNPSSNIWLQVLQPGQRDTSPGLYLFTDYKRYLINTGENTLRHLMDSGLPMKGLDTIMLTGSSVNHIGGLTNTLLAARERPVNKYPINVYGPPNLAAYLQTLKKSFQYLSKFEFVKLNVINERRSWQPVLNDANFKILGWAINDKQRQGGDNRYHTIYPRLAISYAFILHEPLQRYSLDTIETFDVPEDKLQKVAQECQMENFDELPSGELTSSNDVVQAPQPGQCFLVIDCPSNDVFKTLSDSTLTEFLNVDLNAQIDLIVHMAPYEIATAASYKSWMKTFNCQTKHLIMSQSIASNPSPAVFTFDRIYDKLSEKHSQVFPALQYSVTDDSLADVLNSSHTSTIASPSLKYVFRPPRFEGFKESPLRTKVEELLETKKWSDQRSAKIFSSLEPNNDFEVVFLGTGSRVSSVLRNTSGILLNLGDKKSILMDCGEATFRQMCHHYGENIDIILKQLRTVFVSHMHIDHHLGLVNILLQRKAIMGSSDYVRIIGPESLDLYLRYFEMMTGESLKYRFTQFWWLKRGIGKREGRAFSSSLGLSAISVIPTKHSDYSHGLIVERNGWKIAYSADTRPCKQLIDAGQHSTLLIHEATFEDRMLDRAKAVNHCTVSEAIRCSELMKAEHTILTHISSRHLFPCKSAVLPKTVSFAFDHMTIQQKDLSTLQPIMRNYEETVVHYQRGKTSRRKQKQRRTEYCT